MNELETILKKDPHSVTIETENEKLNGRFARIQKSRGVASGNDHKKALSVVSQCLAAMSEEEGSLFVKQFKSLCNKCGKFGHKGADCRRNDVKGTERKDRSPGSFKGKCYYFGQSSHKKANCKRENRSRKWLR